MITVLRVEILMILCRLQQQRSGCPPRFSQWKRAGKTSW